jgi:tetratricopeptide (TPR) repeat protein
MNPQPDSLTDTARRPRLVVWIVGILALTGLGVAFVVVIGGHGVRLERELSAAEEALRQHDPTRARVHLERCLDRWPKDERVLFLAAQAARRSDACADAERLLTAFEETAGTTDASRLEWVLLGVQQGDFAGEEDRLKSAVSRNDPDAPEIVEALAKGYYVAYRWPEATVTLDWLLQQSRGHVPALLLRGTVLDRQRRTDAAEKDFRRAVDLAPENAATHTALAGLLTRLGHTREAIYHYELAQRYRKADPAIRLGMARAFTDAAEPVRAERQLEELLAGNPESADGLVERGRLALRRRRFSEAEPFLARAVRVAPWHREAQELRLIVLKELGRKAAAMECEAQIAALRAEDALGGRLKLRARDNPRDAAVRWDLWLWSGRNGQGEEGLAWLTDVLRLAPRHARAHRAIADHFDRAGQPRRAAMHRAAAAGS